MRTIKLETDMDAATMAAMKPLFDQLANCETDVVLDLERVEFLDSSGIGGIVYLFKRLRARSLDVYLTNVAGQPMRLLQQLRLEFLVRAPEDLLA